MVEETGSVSVAASVPTKLRATGESGCFLLVRVAGHRDPVPRGVVEEIRGAVLSANEDVPLLTTLGDYVTATKRGIAVSVFWNGAAQDASRDWLKAFGGSLSQRGISAKVSTSGTWAPGLEALRRIERTYPAAFVGYRLDEYKSLTEPLRGWQVDSATTRQITDVLQAWGDSLGHSEAWAVLPAARVPIPVMESSEFLARTAKLAPRRKTVTFVCNDRSAFSDATLYDLGQCVTQSVSPTADWKVLLEAQIEQLLLMPEAAEVGMIKNVGTLAGSWMDTDIRWRSLHRTVRLPLDYHRNRHLWGEYVIDAAGIQLLTEKHLSHARDLSSWTVEEVAPDRFLVATTDLEAWFAGLAPDSETIAKARADFGDMILTWEAILANPGPYTVTDPIIVGR